MTKSRWHIPAAIIALGLAVTAAGCLYDVLFAGIPYQDPTPELAARYKHHQQTATSIEAVGGLLFVTGVVIAGILGVASAIRRRTTR